PTPLPLPVVYQANDSRVPTLPAVSRAAEGLPEDRFVFCCFCNSYKITPDVFAAWMAILARAPESVLWLVGDNPTARRNLHAQAQAAGIEPSRLIFAQRVEPERYLARMALGDLFLDTSPYNAGTVASDALRMGLPLLTLSQASFASRMAGSLLNAIGMPETIAASHEDYVGIAVSLATDPARHAALRAKLKGDAWQKTLGDSAGFAKRFEEAMKRVRIRPGE
ncbi:hypothetical protein, partial [Teichococcus deserti]|uniref:O-linked N-acetylglucosamine transferase family protein n=1 Tax=Teichococcus deserti TaxID=1817963 RepID=UPI003B2123BF